MENKMIQDESDELQDEIQQYVPFLFLVVKSLAVCTDDPLYRLKDELQALKEQRQA
jgi:hypothetical protein